MNSLYRFSKYPLKLSKLNTEFNIPFRSLVSFKNIFGDKKTNEEKTEDFKSEKVGIDNDIIFKDFDATKNTEKERLTRLKPYKPPATVQSDIKQLCKEIMGSNFQEVAFDQIKLSDPLLKFNILTKCIEKFDHDISNTNLNDIKTVQDLINYYLTEQKDTNALEELHQKPDLPPNLHINLEYKRFDPATDTFFNGRDAYPKRDTIVNSLWYSKKYKSVIKKKDYFVK